MFAAFLGLVSYTAVTLAIWGVLIGAWIVVIVATGGDFTECDRGECGALGEFQYQTWPLVPLAVLALALVLTWVIFRRGRTPPE
jgi:hypothetical protein